MASIDGKPTYLGTYREELEAAKVAAAWRVAHKGSTRPIDLELAEGVDPPPFKPNLAHTRHERAMARADEAVQELFRQQWDKPGSEYIGVTFHKFSEKWRAGYNGQHLGYFDDRDEAARFMCAWRVAHQTGAIVVTKQQAAFAEGMPTPPKEGNVKRHAS